MSSFCVVMSTCDSYTFTWEGWCYCFEKFWDFTIPGPVYVLDEGISIGGVCSEYPKLNSKLVEIRTNESNWTNRFIKGIDSIEEKYLWFFQEDFWMQNTIHKSEWEFMYNFCVENKVDFMRLDPNCSPGQPKENNYLVDTGCAYKGNIHILKEACDYLASLSPTIWRTEFLKSCLVAKENVWEFEKKGTVRIRNRVHSGEDVRMYWYPRTGEEWFMLEASRKGNYTKEATDFINGCEELQ